MAVEYKTDKDKLYMKKFNRGIKKLTLVKFSIISIVVALFSMILGIYMGLYLSQWKIFDLLLTIMPQNQINPSENIMILGLDDVNGSKRSDTIMVININKRKNRVGVLSIPRDTRVELPERGFTKINHAYAYGGTKLVRETVSRFLQIPIQYYVVLDLQGVREIVDQIGGVSIDVEKKMYYVDKAGDLYIDFKPGKQDMTGVEAEAYLRFRNDKQGDIGRIKRQQKFLKSITRKVLLSKQIFKIPQLIKGLSKHVDTNLSAAQIFNLGLELKSAVEEGKLEVNTLPGAIVLINRVSYWKVDLPAAIKMIDETIHGFSHENITYAAETIITTSLGIATKLTMKEVNQLMPKNEIAENIFQDMITVSVEVLNGNGEKGLASRVAGMLKKRGVVVPKTGNGAHFNYPNTVIVDWKGKTVESLTLAKAININPKNIITYYKPLKGLDITIVLGKDWKTISNPKR